MTRKPKLTNKPKAELLTIDARKGFHLTATSPEDARRNVARMMASPETAAARAIGATEGTKGLGEDLDMPELVDCLRDQAAAINGGNMAHVESMLVNQATALQSLFARLTERAMSVEYLSQFEAQMRIALRAQSQCRATLEALAAIKNPPIVYARQANITAGPQQVNNGTAHHAQAREMAIEQTELSGGSNELLQDARTSGTACGIDSAMATLGAINRTPDRSR